jgi:NAD(P)-dependent dehydrogenase (short-subunit alcohol dehydrogenase family)
MKRFEGKTVFITGGARGQGRSHAVGFASEGANVVVVDIAGPDDAVPHRFHSLAERADLDETVRLVEAQDRQCLAIQADVRDRAAMEDSVERAVAQFGGIDVLIAQAGICTVGSIVDQQHADWDASMGTILTGTWNVVKPAVPHMLERKAGGRIILTVSSLYRWVHPNNVPYATAKFGLVGMLKVLSLELLQHGITVNGVNPGFVDTDMLMYDGSYKNFMPDKPDATREDAEKFFEEFTRQPLIKPRSITEGMLFLASDAADRISGMLLDVSAGTNAWQGS